MVKKVKDPQLDKPLLFPPTPIPTVPRTNPIFAETHCVSCGKKRKQPKLPGVKKPVVPKQKSIKTPKLNGIPEKPITVEPQNFY